MSQKGLVVLKTADEDPDPVSVTNYFSHQDIVRNLKSKKTLSQRKLINLWNRLHFTDEMVHVRLQHPRHKDDLLIEAYPAPYDDNALTCQWPEKSRPLAAESTILDIILADGLTLIMVPVNLRCSKKDSFTSELPDRAYILGKRQAKHFNCQGVSATLVQDGFQAHGQLTDFSSRAFSIKVMPEGIGSFRWFNAGNPSTIHLHRSGKMVFSSSCRCLRQTAEQGVREIVLTPTTNHLSRFLKKKWRSPRVSARPLPNITFEHPLILKTIQLDVKNLSSSGFAVDVSADEDVLMPGMVLSDLNINFSGAFQIPCKAQVLYRREEKSGYIRYGFVILDMHVLAYNRLSHIVMNIIDSGVHVCDEVDPDQLWEFLFDSGFIYPQKYTVVQANRQPMKLTYQQLYRDNPEVTAQLTYQQNGRIYGHASMIRSYRRTWMVHHLAARPLNKKRTGLQVLTLMMHYFNGLYRLPTVGMDYLMFYFRPENRFPDHFFGGFARYFKNPRACSLDLFSYINFPTSTPSKPLPDGWFLDECTTKDLEELGRFYRNTSNGLLLDVLNLDKEGREETSLSKMYARYGLTRNCWSLSLAQNGKLKAVLVVNQSNVGISLSDFLNGLKIMVTDPEGLPWPVLSSAISQVSGIYTIDKIPILIYPFDYFKKQKISFSEKKYNLWIINAHHSREFSEYMMENIKFRIRFIIRLLIKKFTGK